MYEQPEQKITGTHMSTLARSHAYFDSNSLGFPGNVFFLRKLRMKISWELRNDSDLQGQIACKLELIIYHEPHIKTQA